MSTNDTLRMLQDRLCQQEFQAGVSGWGQGFPGGSGRYRSTSFNRAATRESGALPGQYFFSATKWPGLNGSSTGDETSALIPVRPITIERCWIIEYQLRLSASDVGASIQLMTFPGTAALPAELFGATRRPPG